jgi:8-oxo-dGTP pyrophosphatase MutT (NUDIX family)
MEKFSKLKAKEFAEDDKEKILYKDDNVSVIKVEDWSVISDRDTVVCIPYLIESNQVILRYEYIPAFKYADGQEYYVTVISGGVERGETTQIAMLRELEEEAGIVLKDGYHIQFMKPMFKTKGSTGKYYPCILSLTEGDYHEVVAVGDGTKAEDLSKSVKVDVKYLGSLNPSDLVSDYLLGKMRNFINQRD